MTKEYWNKSIPMSFSEEYWVTYEQKREFRYSLQDYMHGVFGFDWFKGQKVLEVGCGSGIDAVEFAKYGAFVTAIDFSEVAVELTQKLAKEAGQKIAVVEASANRIPYKDNTFDCVYSFGVLHHIPEVEEVLSEIQRVLKPGGKVMAMLYHKDSLLYAYSILYLKGETERNSGCPYVKVYTKKEAVSLFERYFSDIGVSIHSNVIDTPQQRKVKLGVDDKYELGWHLIVKGVKK